jgi:hypothetical protein
MNGGRSTASRTQLLEDIIQNSKHESLTLVIRPASTKRMIVWSLEVPTRIAKMAGLAIEMAATRENRERTACQLKVSTQTGSSLQHFARTTLSGLTF